MAKGGNNKHPALDKVVHERARLRILTFLATSDNDESAFNEIQKELEFTAGNLSVQLKNLEEAGYVGIKKAFVENKPRTTVSITENGRTALENYVSEMEKIINSLKL